MSDSVNWPVVGGVVASLVIAGFGVWAGALEFCDADGNCQSKFAAFKLAPFNEVGDTLAGFAGALAFVWIIVTVALQSKELAAQRKELRLTRKELKLARAAQEAQLESMKAQTSILLDEKKTRDELRSLEHLERALNAFISSVTEAPLARWGTTNTDTIGREFKSYVALDFDISATSESADDSFRFIVRRATTVGNDLTIRLSARNLIDLPDSDERLQRAIIRLRHILEIRSSLSKGQRIRFDELGVPALITVFSEIANKQEYWLDAQ